jgi:hypothetical protein
MDKMPAYPFIMKVKLNNGVKGINRWGFYKTIAGA